MCPSVTHCSGLLGTAPLLGKHAIDLQNNNRRGLERQPCALAFCFCVPSAQAALPWFYMLTASWRELQPCAPKSCILSLPGQGDGKEKKGETMAEREVEGNSGGQFLELQYFIIFSCEMGRCSIPLTSQRITVLYVSLQFKHTEGNLRGGA